MGGSKADGILGLCPISGESVFVLDLLLNAGLITNRKISFSLAPNNSPSTLILG